MGLPRSRYVQEGEEGVYHCFSRCVRRAFLCGFDAVTGRDFSHRKAWLVERLRFLAAVFAIEVCAYDVMETHYHNVLRLRPDIVSMWSDREVAERWVKLFPRCAEAEDPDGSKKERAVLALVENPERIAVLRRRLCSLSWFMRSLNEYMARRANEEDQVKGRFWESRFKCQALLDEAAIVAGMAYVDLNPIRAGVAATPEESDYTSIQERIRAWQEARRREEGGVETTPVGCERADETGVAADWLCPISSEPGRRGILGMTVEEYIELVDRSGRTIRSGKRGAIAEELAPILMRIGANVEAWPETVTRFGTQFCLAAGLVSSLRKFADRIGRRWLKGVGAARLAFAPGSPQAA